MHNISNTILNAPLNDMIGVLSHSKTKRTGYLTINGQQRIIFKQEPWRLNDNIMVYLLVYIMQKRLKKIGGILNKYGQQSEIPKNAVTKEETTLNCITQNVNVQFVFK